MFTLLLIAFPPEIFDAAAKVTSWWGLGAFAIAAVVAILLGSKSKVSAGRFPKEAVVVIVIAITVPVAGEVIVASFPKTPYRVTITVKDLRGFVVDVAHVRCGCGIQPAKTEGAAVFEIHLDDVPENRQLTFFADDGKNSGEKLISFGRTRSIAETIALTEQAQATSTVPPPVTWCAQSPAGAPYEHTEDFWPHQHLNGKTEGGDPPNPGAGWYIEWEAPGPVYHADFTHDGSHMEKFECGPVLGRETVAFCHGWKNGGNFMGHMIVQWKQPCSI